ncbi:MAG TPA: hypothetical protein VNY06_00295 [Methylocella sp.]|nr:hypothetical protein [Methylocella sp.]
MPPDQYLACVNGAKNYEPKIVQVSNVIIEAEKAKQEGNSPLAEQKAAEAKSAVAASAGIVTDLDKLAQAAPAARLAHSIDNPRKQRPLSSLKIVKPFQWMQKRFQPIPTGEVTGYT